MKRLMICVCMGLQISLLSASFMMAPKDTLDKIMYHIMHRESASFMRFDESALQLMNEPIRIGQELRKIYMSTAPRMYKASVTDDGYANCLYNPVFMLAQEDLNYCTRFLKLLKKYTKLVVCDFVLPEDLMSLLLSKGCKVLCVQNVYPEYLDELVECCFNEMQEDDEYAIVLTSLRGLSPLFHSKYLQQKGNSLLFDIDMLWTLLVDPTQTLVDRSRFDALMSRNIKFVSTAALIDKKYEQRREQYIRSIKMLNAFGYEPYVVESCAAAPTFLDDYCQQVVYTHTNDASLSNKGINEINALKAFFDHNKDDFCDDDIIVKLTGRYCLVDDYFIRLLENNVVYEAGAMHGIHAMKKSPYIDLYTGMFALKYRYFNHMLASIDLHYMNEHRIWFEWEVSKYMYGLAERHVPVMYVDELHLHHYVFRDSVFDVEHNVPDDIYRV